MSRAAWGSVVFFLVAPGVMSGVVPWLLTAGYDDRAASPYFTIGLVLVVVGVAVLIACFVQFVREGRGTPAPVAPTKELVVGGIYRWVRNPMYLAVATIIVGQAVAFASRGLLLWLAIFLAAVVSFVIAYEQPTLQDTYGESYDAYRRAVPGWWPRLTPWRGPQERPASSR
ncbi:MAG: isoprenylcysteine carboxylmethyltransferase family protein [Nocardioides sp.]